MAHGPSTPRHFCSRLWSSDSECYWRCVMKRIAVGVFLLFSLCAVAEAQAVSSQLMAISDELKEKITKEMPGWANSSIESIEGSINTVIHYWDLGLMSVNNAF